MFLNNALNKAIQLSTNSDDKFAENLGFLLKSFPKSLKLMGKYTQIGKWQTALFSKGVLLKGYGKKTTTTKKTSFIFTDFFFDLISVKKEKKKKKKKKWMITFSLCYATDLFWLNFTNCLIYLYFCKTSLNKQVYNVCICFFFSFSSRCPRLSPITVWCKYHRYTTTSL